MPEKMTVDEAVAREEAGGDGGGVMATKPRANQLVDAAKRKLAAYGWRITEVMHDLPEGDGSRPFESGTEYSEPGWNVFAWINATPTVSLDVRGYPSLPKALAEIVTRVEKMEAS